MGVCGKTFGCRGHGRSIGVLVAQLGTPDEPTPGALRRYLKEFLWDPRVIEVSRPLWWLILNGIILNTRPKRSAKLYKRIWTEKGSPLLLISENQIGGLRKEFSGEAQPIHFELGMRYGSPSIANALDKLIEKGCSRILVLPMYPHYAAATTGSTYDAVFGHLLRKRWVPTTRVVDPYFDDARYVGALATTINEAWNKFERKPEKLVLSYHGIPEAYINKGDPYCCMCTETTAALIPQLRIGGAEVIHTYQSRFGNDPWLVPYTDETIKKLAKEGVKHIALACPGFTADCLETLDELGNEGKHLFQEHGGEGYDLIPCLNDHPSWISGMAGIVREELHGWLSDSCIDTPRRECPVQRAKAAGA